MKKLFLASLIFLASCGNNPAPVPVPPVPPGPVPPPPVTSFEVTGAKILVHADMKPNAKVSLNEMRAAIMAAVAQLEPK